MQRTPSRGTKTRKDRKRKDEQSGVGSHGRRASNVSEKSLNLESALQALKTPIGEMEPASHALALAEMQILLNDIRPVETRAVLTSPEAIQLIQNFPKTTDDPEVKWRSASLLASLVSPSDPIVTSLIQEIQNAIEAISQPLTEPHADDESMNIVLSASSFLGSLASVVSSTDPCIETFSAAVHMLCVLLKSSSRDLQQSSSFALHHFVLKSRSLLDKMRDEGGIVSLMSLIIQILNDQQASPFDIRVASLCCDLLSACFSRDFRSRAIAFSEINLSKPLVSSLVTNIISKTESNIQPVKSCCSVLASLVEGNQIASKILSETVDASVLTKKISSMLNNSIECSCEVVKFASSLCKHSNWITPCFAAGFAQSFAICSIKNSPASRFAASGLELLLDSSPSACVEIIKIPDLLESLIVAILSKDQPTNIRNSISKSISHIVERCSQGKSVLSELGGIAIFFPTLKDPEIRDSSLAIIRAMAVFDSDTAQSITYNQEVLSTILDLASVGNFDALLCLLACCWTPDPEQKSFLGTHGAIKSLCSALHMATESAQLSIDIFASPKEIAQTSLIALGQLAKCKELAVTLCEVNVANEGASAVQRWPELLPEVETILQSIGSHDTSAMFHLRGSVPAGISLSDGFFVVPKGKKFLTLESIAHEPVTAHSTIAYVYSPSKDKALSDLITKTIEEVSKCETNDIAKKVQILLTTVKEQMGGSISKGASFCSSPEEALLKERLHSNVVLISEVHHGCLDIRGVLFKGLAECCGIPCTLEEDGAINLQGSQIKIDLLN